VILDSSAIVAILAAEPDVDSLLAKLATAGVIGVGTPTLLETAFILSRHGADARTVLEAFVRGFSITVVPFTEPHWFVAFEAFRRFGKGRHPAGLNFGDCMAYAVARLAGRPLLCRGEDFPRTDLELA
jgi:ribonuclease VapC